MKARTLIWLPLVAALSITGCSEGSDRPGVDGEAPSQAAASYQDISLAQFESMMAEKDFFLVNVHIPFQGDIPGTDESIRFDEIADHLDQLPEDRDEKIVLYCRSGRMSAEAGEVLASLGYTNVFNLEGGFIAWEAAGHPLER